MRFLHSIKLILQKSEFMSQQMNSKFQKSYLSGIPRYKFHNKRKRRNPRKTHEPKMRNHAASQSSLPLFDEILGILGTENVIVDQSSAGFSNMERTYEQTRIGEIRVGPSNGPQGSCLNSEQRIEQEEEEQRIEEEEENHLLSEDTLVDAVDVSPLVHKITEIVRDENGSASMGERLEDAGLEYNVEIVEKVLKRCFKVPRLALRFFEWVKSKEGFCHSTETYNTVIYIAGEAKEFEMVELLLEEMEKDSCQKNIKTWTILIGQYGKAKLISKALLIFDKMKKSGVEPDVTAYRIMLLYLCKAGKADIAFEYFKEMIDKNVGLSMGLCQQLLKCLAISGNGDAVYAVHNDMVKSSEIPEQVLYGFMLKSFCIAGKIREALELIRTLKDRNIGLVPENLKNLVKGLCRADRIGDALEMVNIMKKKNSVDEEIYEILVNGYLRKNDVSCAFDLLQKLKDSGCQPTLATYTNLMQHLIQIKEFQKALELYNDMVEIGVNMDNVAATALVAGFIRQNCISEAWLVFNSMVEKGVRMTPKSYSIFLKELSKVSATDDIVKMLIEMQASKIKIGDDIFQFVVSYMEKKGQMEKGKKIQQMSKTYNLVPRENNSLVANRNVEPEPYVKLKSEMLEQKFLDHDVLELTPKSYKEDDLHEICRILSSSKDWCSIQDDLEKYAARFTTELVVDILQKCSLHNGAALRFFLWVGKQSGYRHDTKSYNMAIKLSGRAKDFKNMRSLFDEMRRNGCPITSDTWTIMMMQYGRTGLTDIALRTFREMKASSCKPNESTYKFLVISLCGRKGRKADEAVQIFQEMIRAGFHPDKEMLEAYLSCLCEVGKLPEARKAIESLQRIGFTVPLTCSLYIRALCGARKVEEALAFVEEFGPDEKHTLDQYTYGSLVHGLLRAGRIEEAMEKVESMKQVGVHPTVHVYTSLIVHFFKQRQVCRAWETLETMKGMGCQPTTVTYSAMVRGYMEMGKISDAWDVFGHMKRHGPFPDFKTYSMFIACLCKTGSSEEALQLLGDMLDRGMIPSTVNFRTVMYGLNREGKHNLAKTVLRKKLDLKFQRKLLP